MCFGPKVVQVSHQLLCYSESERREEAKKRLEKRLNQLLKFIYFYEKGTRPRVRLTRSSVCQPVTEFCTVRFSACAIYELRVYCITDVGW